MRASSYSLPKTYQLQEAIAESIRPPPTCMVTASFGFSCLSRPLTPPDSTGSALWLCKVVEYSLDPLFSSRPSTSDGFDTVHNHSLNYIRKIFPPSLAEPCTFGQFHRVSTTVSRDKRRVSLADHSLAYKVMAAQTPELKGTRSRYPGHRHFLQSNAHRVGT